MAKYTGPKHKRARREGIDIYGKNSASLDRRINVIPGSHGKRRTRKLSEYGIQLREKQKLKRIYGVLEKQFRNYVLDAQRKNINTEDALVQLLESRLDNIVYRLGFGKSRFQARQLVSHRHVLVNGEKVNVPSYKISEGDIITIVNKIQTEDLKLRLEENKEVPSFLSRENLAGKIERLPMRDDIVNPVNYQSVIEFYSR